MLDQKLVETILKRLGLDDWPHPDIFGLTSIYSAWCQRIPFDNIRKLIHLNSGTSSPLPGNNPVDFFTCWLRYGTGGTCWAGSDALYTLLKSLGFDVERGVATMLVSPNDKPNHGTVIAVCDGKRFLVDTSMLHSTPLMLEGYQTANTHPAWKVSGTLQRNKWHIEWRALHQLSGLTCRIEYTGASRETFIELNEQTRKWSPFNYSLYVRQNRGEAVIGIAYQHTVLIDSSGTPTTEYTHRQAMHQLLINQIGIHEDIIDKLPPDKPLPKSPDFV